MTQYIPEPIYIRHQSPSFEWSERLHQDFVAAAFDEGARYRKPNDPLYGFPVWDIADLFLNGA